MDEVRQTAERFENTRVYLIVMYNDPITFLGVNQDGLVGLHFTLLPRRNKDQMLELSRLPYLKDSESLAEADTAE